MSEGKLALVAFSTLVVANLLVFHVVNRLSPKKGLNWRAIVFAATVAVVLFHLVGLAIDWQYAGNWIPVTLPIGGAYAFVLAAGANLLLQYVHPPKPEALERRRVPRLRPMEPIYARCPDERRVRDIGLGGAFIEESHPLHAGRRVQLELRLATGEPVVISGMVRRVEDGRGMGVQFLSMTETHHNRLRQFLTAPS
jgi:hypothetical protein